MSTQSDVDFDVRHHITVAMLLRDSDAARAWCDAHLATDDVLMWGHAYVIEPRYLEEILRTIVGDGLTVRLKRLG